MEHLVENGTVAGTFLENDTLRYQCDPEYSLVGDEVITCGTDGQWNGTTDSHCKLSKCRSGMISGNLDGLKLD